MFFHHKKRKKHGKDEAPAKETVLFEDEPLEVPETTAENASSAELDEDGGESNSAEATGSGADPERMETSDEDRVDDAEEDEILEIEFDEDDIQCYLVDEDDNEIGFVLLDEDGNEVEYYYADEESDEEVSADEEAADKKTPKAKSSAKKNTSLAYKAGAAAATAAATGKSAAKKGAEKAKEGVEKARGWADRFQPDDDGEYDLGITREGVQETTEDMNVIYHEGVETIAELKSAFDDIKDGLDLGGLLGKKK